MRLVFADTFYWISLINPRDQWHNRARVATESLAGAGIVTTDEVLIELLNYYCGFGVELRAACAQFVHGLMESDAVELVPQSRESLLSGLHLYENRLDKGYSLTDCISMQTMRERGITDVLTHDRHFAQEGFNLLLNDH